MNRTGKTIDGLGRIVIPVGMRRTLGIDCQTPLRIYERDHKIIVEVAIERCRLCGSEKVVPEKLLCQSCIDRIKQEQ